jgi:DNA invertase Pin-like site-specific DNA recombinase
MKRVLAYLRVSTAAQTDGDGFPRQKEACKVFAEGRGWNVARYFEEQQSGSDQLFDRPKMQELLALCGEQYDTIIVERVDRIARDIVIAELFFRECKARGVQVFSADSGEELVNATGDPTRTLIRQILGALAEWDKAQICKKLLAGRKRKKLETGRPCGGPKPYGRNEEENLVIDKIIRLVRRKRHTLEAIAGKLQSQKIPTPGGATRWSRGIVFNIARANQNRLLGEDIPHIPDIDG